MEKVKETGGRWRTYRVSNAGSTATHPSADMGRALGAHRGGLGPGWLANRVAGKPKTRARRRRRGRVGGKGVNTYTFLQADRKGQDDRIGIGMGPQIRALDRNPPPRAQPGDTTTQRVRLCGPAYPKGVGVIQGGVDWKSENPPKTLPKLSEILPPSLKTLPKLSENHAASNPKTI